MNAQQRRYQRRNTRVVTVTCKIGEGDPLEYRDVELVVRVPVFWTDAQIAGHIPFFERMQQQRDRKQAKRDAKKAG